MNGKLNLFEGKWYLMKRELLIYLDIRRARLCIKSLDKK